MNVDISYRRLVRKIHFLELVGRSLYKELALKEKDSKLKEIYLKLSENEKQSAKYIEKQMSNFRLSFVQKISAGFAAFVFRLAPNKITSCFLKNILEKRMYRRWSAMYNTFNPELWHLLLEHEEIQFELLSPYWDRLK